jgi:hypothetical protein
VYATAYERPGQGLLLFVSNLSDRDVDAAVAIDFARLGWQGVPKVWDAVSQEAIRCDRDAVRLRLGSWRYQVVRVRPEK